MARTKQIELSTGTVTVRELTVAEMRAWVLDLETSDTAINLVDSMLLVDLRLQDLARATDILPETIEGLAQSDLTRMVEAIKEMNPSFFDMLVRLAKAGQQLMDAGLQASSGESASL